ncbi:hypothetical protein I79_003848 [Cricetulus griseus]|uniref:Uncharacterized protein n=1 Tax=Cricetulus griseus TaxID=10029 RepID=G3H126_CRIGR|nr:hypothetical protein I79_003848 [Cricetulus griseus]
MFKQSNKEIKACNPSVREVVVEHQKGHSGLTPNVVKQRQKGTVTTAEKILQ